MEELKSILCMIMEFFYIGEGVFVMEALFPHKVSISSLDKINPESSKHKYWHNEYFNEDV